MLLLPLSRKKVCLSALFKKKTVDATVATVATGSVELIFIFYYKFFGHLRSNPKMMGCPEIRMKPKNCI